MTPQEQTDAQHLKLLSIFHFVLAGFYFLALPFLVFHYFFMKTLMAVAEETPPEPGSPPPPDLDAIMAMVGWLYVAIGIAVLLLIIANVVAAISLRARRRRVFTFVVAGINCLNMPFGTALGVFTFIVLLRPSIAASYESRA